MDRQTANKDNSDMFRQLWENTYDADTLTALSPDVSQFDHMTDEEMDEYIKESKADAYLSSMEAQEYGWL